MGRKDLSEELAKRICQDICDRTGGSFQKRLYEINRGKPNEFLISDARWIGVYDEGREIRLVASGFSESERTDLTNCLKDIKVPIKYDDVFNGVYIRGDGENLVIGMKFVPRANSAGRIQREDRIFYALKHTGLKRLLKATSEINKNK